MDLVVVDGKDRCLTGVGQGVEHSQRADVVHVEGHVRVQDDPFRVVHGSLLGVRRGKGYANPGPTDGSEHRRLLR